MIFQVVLNSRKGVLRIFLHPNFSKNIPLRTTTRWQLLQLARVPLELMEKRKQTPIDAHFKRNIKLKTGEMVQCLPSKIKNPEAHFLLPCEFPGCSKKCANKGAVANHRRFAHDNRIAVGSISSFVIRKPPNIIDCFKSLAISTLAMHLVSNAPNLSPVPYLRPILRPFIPAEPEEKVDGRKFNQGEDHRVPINYLLKAKILDEYIEKKKKRIQPTAKMRMLTGGKSAKDSSHCG